MIEGRDLGTDKFDAAVQDFTRKSVGADLALFYYSGHGLQFDGANYLVPVDARIDSVTALKRRAVIAQDVVDQIERGAKANLVFLDACRNNTLTRDLAQSLPEQSRSTMASRGLARMNANGNSLIAFAAAPNDVAADGTGQRNSPFTAAVLKHIETPNIVVPEMLTEVTADVVRVTNNRQKPEVLSRLVTQVRMKMASLVVVPAPQIVIPTPPLPEQSREREASVAWEAAKASCDLDRLSMFAQRYRDTFFGDLAKKRLELIASGAVCAPANAVHASADGSSQTKRDVDDEAFVRSMQVELKRVGCYSGTIDGKWSGAAQRSLREFGKQSSTALDESLPTRDLLKRIALAKARVCPLICAEIEVLNDGKCIPKPKAEPPKPEQPSVAAFNGAWSVSWNGPTCYYKTGQGRIQINNGSITGTWSGQVAANGSFAMSVMSNGSLVEMRGKLSGRAGSGSFSHSNCSGTIGASRI